jgi:hypothetical protein
VSTFSPPLVAVGVDFDAELGAVGAVEELAAAEELAAVELPLELLEDPQPLASASAAQAISVEAPLFIAAGTLA